VPQVACGVPRWRVGLVCGATSHGAFLLTRRASEGQSPADPSLARRVSVGLTPRPGGDRREVSLFSPSVLVRSHASSCGARTTSGRRERRSFRATAGGASQSLPVKIAAIASGEEPGSRSCRPGLGKACERLRASRRGRRTGGGLQLVGPSRTAGPAGGCAWDGSASEVAAGAPEASAGPWPNRSRTPAGGCAWDGSASEVAAGAAEVSAGAWPNRSRT